jgi:hypothetical protein
MQLIQYNPYRIAGLLANASATELDRQKNKISLAAGIGRQVDSDLDFSFLETIDRTDINEVNKAFSSIEQSQDKVNHSLFWFINANKYDDITLEYLKAGEREKALNQWEKVTKGKDVTLSNFSCFNNIGTLKLLCESSEELKEGIEAKIKLIESDSFKDFVHTVADQTHTIDSQKQTEKFIDDLLRQLKNKYSTADKLKLFSNCNGTTQNYLSKKFTEEPLHHIETQIESTKNKRKANKAQAYDYGLKLYKKCKDDLKTLKNLLGTSDLKYIMTADKLANEIIQCGIDYFKESQDNDVSSNYFEDAMELAKLAESIAVGNLTKDRVKDSINSLEELKDKEISEAIILLKSVKDAFEANERSIMVEVRRQKASLGYGQTINWTKVSDMINNSIDWGKVVELIHSVIPRQNIEKIKNVNDSSKINEYKSLVNFLFSKLSYSNKSRVNYLSFWETTKRSTGSTSTHRPETFTPADQGLPTWAIIVIVIIVLIVLANACD